MKTQFIKVKRILIPMIMAVAIVAQGTVSALALDTEDVSDLITMDGSIVMEVGEVDALSAAAPIARASTSFTDLSEVSWAVDAINDMANRGVINGVGNNKFAPTDNVTRQEFAAMAIRAFGGENKVNELAQQMSAKAEAEGGSLSSLKEVEEAYGSNWSNEVMVASQYFPEIAQVWSCRLSEWSKEANRAEMAFIVMTIAESLGDEKFEITDGINTVIGDFNEVSGSPFASSITKAYSNGILVGMNSNGDYKPNENANRAEAATIMQRLVDPSKRKEVEVNIEPEEPEGSEGLSPLPDGSNIGKYTDAIYPKEGDIINGVKVTRDPITGVLGYGNGQKGGIYLGIKERIGPNEYSTIEVGSRAIDTYDGMSAGNIYTQIGDYIFWDGEWGKIISYVQSKMPTASAKYVGKCVDINGNIVEPDSGATILFECKHDSVLGIYSWYQTF